MVVFMGEMYVLGSYTTNSCEVFDLTTFDSTFELIDERPKMQKHPIILMLKNQVWLLGGLNANNHCISMVQRYDICTNSWSSMADLKKFNLS